jgi:hypothetical protein
MVTMFIISTEQTPIHNFHQGLQTPSTLPPSLGIMAEILGMHPGMKSPSTEAQCILCPRREERTDPVQGRDPGR